jgi:hypothetical protein
MQLSGSDGVFLNAEVADRADFSDLIVLYPFHPFDPRSF